MRIFAVYDHKAQDFGQPFFNQNTATALRAFTDLVNDPSTTVFKYPDDFTLFEIGHYESNTGIITPLELPQIIGNASEYKRNMEVAA